MLSMDSTIEHHRYPKSLSKLCVFLIVQNYYTMRSGTEKQMQVYVNNLNKQLALATDGVPGSKAPRYIPINL